MNEKYLKKRIKNVRNQALDVLEKPGFIEAVAELRKKWNVKPEGITDINESQEWYGWLYQQQEHWRRIEWPKIRPKILELKKAGKSLEADKLTKQYNDKAPINALHVAIEKLVHKFDLEDKWHDGVKGYMLTNNPTALQSFLSNGISHQTDLATGRMKNLSISITKDTTLKDMNAMWSQVEFFQSMLPGKTKEKNVVPRNRERDEKIYDLQKRGKTYTEIGKQFGLEYNQVSTILRNYRRRTGKS